jgi:hypothetical protein
MVSGGVETFDRRDVPALEPGRGPDTRAYRRAVDEHGTGSTGADSTAVLRTGQIEDVSQRPQQGHVLWNVDRMVVSVDRESDFAHTRLPNRIT